MANWISWNFVFGREKKFQIDLCKRWLLNSVNIYISLFLVRRIHFIWSSDNEWIHSINAFTLKWPKKIHSANFHRHITQCSSVNFWCFHPISHQHIDICVEIIGCHLNFMVFFFLLIIIKIDHSKIDGNTLLCRESCKNRSNFNERMFEIIRWFWIILWIQVCMYATLALTFCDIDKENTGKPLSPSIHIGFYSLFIDVDALVSSYNWRWKNTDEYNS